MDDFVTGLVGFVVVVAGLFLGLTVFISAGMGALWVIRSLAVAMGFMS